nr:RNA-directed DNA polymerase, eukaryota [Tanacetum cinerariifolium]
LHQTSNSFYVAEKVAWIEIEGWAPNFIDDYSDSDEESVDSKFDNFQKEKSEDPFNIYAMLNKKKPENSAAQQSEGDLQYPPGFTPRDISKVNSHLDQVDEFADNGVDSKISHKENVNTLGCSDYFIMVRGVWVPNGKNLLIISVYAPQELSEKKMLWDYLALVIASWKGEVVMIGNFNEVRKKEERFGSNFNVQGADAFNSFIPKAGLEEVEAFDKFVKETWNEVPVYKSNDMINLIKKLKYLKENIRVSNKDKQMNSKLGKTTFKEELAELDTVINKGEGDIVNEVQPAFIADRQILDGLFILTGLVQWCKSKKKQLLIFKVDFGKAYDSVCWDYLDDILKKFGFGERWCWWIQSCLRSSRGSVIVKGSPTKEFQFYKGLKQGDPLSPFLFILFKESLHNSFQMVVDAGMFKGIVVNPSLYLSHMFYANDAVSVGQWSKLNIDAIVHVLDCFYRASGLRINTNKSKLMGIYVDGDIVDQAAPKIGCVTLKSPFSYLGSKVGGLMSRINSWNESIDCMVARLFKWKMKTLLVGDRLTLIKAVLGSMSIYNMSLFKVPMKVLHRMESIRCHFFNGAEIDDKKPIWVKWKNVLASKQIGGLGVSSLYALNIALIFLIGYGDFSLNILRYGRGPLKRFTVKMGKLERRLYALKNIKDVIVALKLSYRSLDFSFRRSPRGGVEQSQFLSLMAKVDGVVLGNLNDRWSWSLSGSGYFFVASVRKLIDDKMLPKVSFKSRWCKAVPIKVNILAWKVKLDCLPNRLNISRRGMDIDSILCPICVNAVESTRHIFLLAT